MQRGPLVKLFKTVLGLILLSQGALGLNARFVAFRIPEGPVEVELSSPVLEETKKIEVNKSSFTNPFDLPEGRYTAKCEKLGQPFQFDLPAIASGKYMLIVVCTKVGQWAVVPVSDDNTHFSKGDYLVINATPTDVGLQFSDSKMAVRSNKTAVMKMPRAEYDHDQFGVEIFTVLDQKKVIFNSTVWKRTPLLRTLVLLYVDPVTKRYRTSTMGDYEFEPEAAEGAASE